MRVFEARHVAGHAVDRFGSEGFTVSPVGRAVHSVLARLEAGGRIGRHPAVLDQLFVVLAGEATVSGEDGAEVTIGPGQVAAWSAGEFHETRSEKGVVALVLEAEGLVDALA